MLVDLLRCWIQACHYQPRIAWYVVSYLFAQPDTISLSANTLPGVLYNPACLGLAKGGESLKYAFMA